MKTLDRALRLKARIPGRATARPVAPHARVPARHGHAPARHAPSHRASPVGWGHRRIALFLACLATWREICSFQTPRSGEFATSVGNEAQRAAKRKARKCWGSFLTPTYGIAMFSGSERILSQYRARCPSYALARSAWFFTIFTATYQPFIGAERRLTAAGRQAAGGPGRGFGAVLANPFTVSPCGSASQDAPRPPAGTRFCHFPPGDPFLDHDTAARRAGGPTGHPSAPRPT